jgi:hypothetical protein
MIDRTTKVLLVAIVLLALAAVALEAQVTTYRTVMIEDSTVWIHAVAGDSAMEVPIGVEDRDRLTIGPGQTIFLTYHATDITHHPTVPMDSGFASWSYRSNAQFHLSWPSAGLAPYSASLGYGNASPGDSTRVYLALMVPYPANDSLVAAEVLADPAILQLLAQNPLEGVTAVFALTHGDYPVAGSFWNVANPGWYECNGAQYPDLLVREGGFTTIVQGEGPRSFSCWSNRRPPAPSYTFILELTVNGPDSGNYYGVLGRVTDMAGQPLDNRPDPIVSVLSGMWGNTSTDPRECQINAADGVTCAVGNVTAGAVLRFTLTATDGTPLAAPIEITVPGA